MAARWAIDADLTFSVTTPTGGDGGEQVTAGSITGQGRHLEVRFDDLGAVSSGASIGQGKAVAAELARQRLAVTLIGPHGPVVSVGDVKANRLARLLTRSKHIRVENWRAAASLAGVAGSADSGVTLAPPATPWPIAPTFKWSRRRATTTHDPDGGGRPRLVFSMGSAAQAGQPRRVHDLTPNGTSIGSAESSALVLADVAPQQAEVRRDSDDEYILVALSDNPPTKVNGVHLIEGNEKVLRTGTRLQIGRWTMTYTRAEFADHGRPYGGRAGGEFSQQRKQDAPRYKS
ncbi:MAG: FHA domain-containing protein [Ornithinimicrobium sp.]